MAVLYPSRGLFVLGLDSVEQVGPDGLEPEYANRDRARVQQLDEGLLRRCAHAHVRRGHGRAARRRRRGGRSAPVRRGARVQGDLPRARDGQPPPVAPPCVRPALGRGRAPRRVRSRSTVVGRRTSRPTSASRSSPKMMLWHSFSQPLGIQFVTACFTGGASLQALPRPARRAARGQLLVGAVVHVPPRRALRVDGLVRGARAHHEAVRLLPAQLLDLGRERRGPPSRTSSTPSGTTSWVTSTDYPARRLEVPARGRRVRQAAMTDDAKAATVSTNWSELYKIPLVKQV